MKDMMKPMMKPKQMNMTGPKCTKMTEAMKEGKMPADKGGMKKGQKKMGGD